MDANLLPSMTLQVALFVQLHDAHRSSLLLASWDGEEG